jgi:hypothetical protein|tara:strand:- start:2177 stop:2407 length:231 start_codon:yes stop_codon:yes gene_type:complete
LVIAPAARPVQIANGRHALRFPFPFVAVSFTTAMLFDINVIWTRHILAPPLRQPQQNSHSLTVFAVCTGDLCQPFR